MAENKSIIIHGNRIEETASGAAMITRVSECGRPRSLVMEVARDYAQYLTPETADGVLWLVLPLALRYGWDVISHVPVTDAFLANIRDMFVPCLLKGDQRVRKISIEAPTVINPCSNANGVGTAITLGQDSLYTVMRYLDPPEKRFRLTHLLIAAASIELVDGNIASLKEWRETFAVRLGHIENFCAEIGLPLIHIWSNYMGYGLTKRYGLLHPTLNMWHIGLHNYITMSMVMGLKRLFRLYFFSSGFSFINFTLENNQSQDTSYYELLQMHTLTVPNFFCYSGGVSLTKEKKVARLLDFPLSRKYLHPCFVHEPVNCSSPGCPKCLRALLTLDMFGVLDDYAQVFDIKRYKNEKESYLLKLYMGRRKLSLKDIYPWFKKNYPLEMLNIQIENAESEAERAEAKKEYRNIAFWLPILRSIKPDTGHFSLPETMASSSLKFLLTSLPAWIYAELTRKKEAVTVALRCETLEINDKPDIMAWIEQLGVRLTAAGFDERPFYNVTGYEKTVPVGDVNTALNSLAAMVCESAASMPAAGKNWV